MKYTQKRINIIINAHDDLKTHVGNVAESLGHRGSVEEICRGWGDTMQVTMSSWRCDNYDSETVDIPLDLITCDASEFTRKLAERQEAERVERDRIYQQNRVLEEAKRRERDIKQLAELKAKYEPNNQGDTP